MSRAPPFASLSPVAKHDGYRRQQERQQQQPDGSYRILPADQGQCQQVQQLPSQAL